MTNIEIKAHYHDVERAEENLNALGAGLAGTFHQKDTYFNVAQGRLKLRELGTDEGHLIFYHREDLAGPKRSDYEIAKTEDPEGLRNILSSIHGVLVEVGEDAPSLAVGKRAHPPRRRKGPRPVRRARGRDRRKGRRGVAPSRRDPNAGLGNHQRPASQRLLRGYCRR